MGPSELYLIELFLLIICDKKGINPPICFDEFPLEKATVYLIGLVDCLSINEINDLPSDFRLWIDSQNTLKKDLVVWKRESKMWHTPKGQIELSNKRIKFEKIKDEYFNFDKIDWF